MAEDEIVQKIKIEVDGTTEAEAEVKRVSTAIDALTKAEAGTVKVGAEGTEETIEQVGQVGEAVDALKENAATVEVAAEGIDDVKDEFEELNEVLEDVKDQTTIEVEAEGVDDVKDEVKDLGDALEDVKDKATTVELKVEGVDDVKDQIKEVADEVGTLAEKEAAIEVSAEGADEARDDIKEVGSTIDEVKDKDVSVDVKTEGADEAKDDIDKVKEAADDLKDAEATVKIEAEGADQAESDIKGVEDAIRGASATFEEFTRSISSLGTTAEEALGRAREAAEEFGASLQQLQSVEGIIEALASRSEQGALSFQELTANLDQTRGAAEEAGKGLDNLNTAATVASAGVDALNVKNILVARGMKDVGAATTAMTAGMSAAGQAAAGVATSVAQVAPAATQAAAGLAQTATAATQTQAAVGGLSGVFAAIRGAFSSLGQTFSDLASRIELTRQNIRTLSTTARALSIPIGPFTSFLSVLSRVGGLLGPTGAIVIGITLFGAALVKLGTNALEAQKNIQRMADAAGVSFNKMAAGQEVFEKLGVNAKTFGEIAQNVFDKVITKTQELAEKLTSSAEKYASSVTNVRKAQLDLNEAIAKVRGGEEAEKLVRKQQEHERAVIAATEKYRALGQAIKELGNAAANDLGKVVQKVEQMASGMKDVKFDQGTSMATIIDAVSVAIGKAREEGRSWGEVLGNIIQLAPRLEALQIGKEFGLSEKQVDSIRKGTMSVSELIAEVEKAKNLEIKPNLAGVQFMLDQFKNLKETWNDLVKTLGESNIGQLFALSFGGMIFLIERLVRGIDLLITGIEKVINFLRLMAGLAAQGIANKIFGMSPEDAEKLKNAIAGIDAEANKVKNSLGGTDKPLADATAEAERLRQALTGIQRSWGVGDLADHALCPANAAGVERRHHQPQRIQASTADAQRRERTGIADAAAGVEGRHHLDRGVSPRPARTRQGQAPYLRGAAPPLERPRHLGQRVPAKAAGDHQRAEDR